MALPGRVRRILPPRECRDRRRHWGRPRLRHAHGHRHGHRHRHHWPPGVAVVLFGVVVCAAVRCGGAAVTVPPVDDEPKLPPPSRYFEPKRPAKSSFVEHAPGVLEERVSGTTPVWPTLAQVLPHVTQHASMFAQFCAHDEAQVDGVDPAVVQVLRAHPHVAVSVNARDDVMDAIDATIKGTGLDAVSRPLLVYGTVDGHWDWLRTNRAELLSPRRGAAAYPVLWLTGAACDPTHTTYTLLQSIAATTPRAVLVLHHLRRPQQSNQQQTRIPTGPPVRYMFTGGDTYNGEQEPTWAYLRPALPLNATYVLYTPQQADEEWGIVAYSVNPDAYPLPELPAAVTAALRREVTVLQDVPSPHGTVDGAAVVEQYRLPPVDAPQQFTYAPGTMLPLTNEAQADLFARQHPRSCHDSKFVVMGMFMAGIGSLVHKVSFGLAVAHELGRVLVINDTVGAEYTQPEFCGGVTSLECFFLPLSNCSLHDVYAAHGPPQPFRCHVDQTDVPVLGLQDFGVHSVPNRVEGFTFRSHCRRGLHHKWLPQHWLARLHDTPPLTFPLFVWWRAQSATYIMRLNRATNAFVQQARAAYFPRGALQRGTVSLHVRHGDKWTDGPGNELVPFKRYVHLAETAFAGVPAVASAKAAFLSTESPLVTAEARVAHRDWDIAFLPVRRDNMRPAERAAVMGKSLEMLLALLQLHLALECDAWVCTRSSNWCRLIDELRGTVAGKHHLRHNYVEAGPITPTVGNDDDHWFW